MSSRLPPPPRTTLFPYTTLFRSLRAARPEISAREAAALVAPLAERPDERPDRKSTRLNSSHGSISYAVFALKKEIAAPPAQGARVMQHLARLVLLAIVAVAVTTDVIASAKFVDRYTVVVQLYEHNQFFLQALCALYVFTPTAPPQNYTLSLHDALPISSRRPPGDLRPRGRRAGRTPRGAAR